MDELRKPLFIVALVLALVIVMVEAGANWFPKGDKGRVEGIPKFSPDVITGEDAGSVEGQRTVLMCSWQNGNAHNSNYLRNETAHILPSQIWRGVIRDSTQRLLAVAGLFRGSA